MIKSKRGRRSGEEIKEFSRGRKKREKKKAAKKEVKGIESTSTKVEKRGDEVGDKRSNNFHRTVGNKGVI